MIPNKNVYLDYAATTPVDPRVIAKMLPYFSEVFGNPSSVHFYGQQAEAALEHARKIIADAIQARQDEIIFTGCGTESDNLAVRGVALARRKEQGTSQILISPVEHYAVSHTANQLADEFGFKVDYLPVDKYGRVDPADVEAYLQPNTALVSVVYANNEIGSINPISEIGKVCRKHNVPFHTDAVQGAAYLLMNVTRDQVDLLSICGHKLYGPKGVGALYVRHGQTIHPVQTGGKQEIGIRAGTHNVPNIVGMAEALLLAQVELSERTRKLTEIRDYLIKNVLEKIPECHLTGHPSIRLPNHASFVFGGVDGNHLLMMLDMAGFSCSSGSACKSGSPKPSDILLAIGIPLNWALGSLRVTLGLDTTMEQIDSFLQVLPKLVEKAKK